MIALEREIHRARGSNPLSRWYSSTWTISASSTTAIGRPEGDKLLIRIAGPVGGSPSACTSIRLAV